MADTINIIRAVEAERWVDGGELPRGCAECQVEIIWSADRSCVYYTYAGMRVGHWMGTAKNPGGGPAGDGVEHAMKGWIVYTPNDGSPKYWRETYPFMFWSIKSEGSVTRDHRPVFLDATDKEAVAVFHDFAALEQWPNPIPRFAEFREYDSGYGRGYRPVYIASGSWLLREEVPDGHNNLGKKTVVRVVTDEELQAMKRIGAEHDQDTGAGSGLLYGGGGRVESADAPEGAVRTTGACIPVTDNTH